MAGQRSGPPVWRYRACYADKDGRAAVYRKKIDRARKRTRRVIFAGELLATAAAVWLLFGVLFGLAVVQGSSMLPTLRSGDLLLVSRVSPPRAGDVVLFRHEGREYVKRIVAGPGDEVALDESAGTVLVNGEPLREDYALSPTLPLPNGAGLPVKLGEEEFFVLGDNRPLSQDSRLFGPIHRGQIDGTVLALLRLSA